MAIFREEVFGPVVTVTPSAGVWTGNGQRGETKAVCIAT
jgi:acyl-CoA reductase-like NAD-dependent aldehyde dehydrogenase